jgi:hypothetical protein
MARERAFRWSLRLTEFPYPRVWGFLVWFIKTFEVITFRLLQSMGLYRPQKSIVAIPSLATRQFTSIQAVVYNGTQEEVLGFRPRRLIYRLFKGLPDLESFERLRFQLAFGEKTIRSVEASTETRGFMHLQVPWSLPGDAAEKAYLRITPLGVETFLGRVALGDYETLSSPVFFLTPKVKWILLTDIDDTIKESNIRETTHWKKLVSSLFRGNYYTYRAIDGMASLYRELAERGVLIVYLTSTPFQLAPFLLKFLREREFPEGPVYLRWLGYNRFGHKWRVLHRILSNGEDQRFVLIGDSGEQDLAIYRRIADNPGFVNKIEKVLIRHVPGTAWQRTLHPREILYKDIEELRATLSFMLP